jgi:hypothetical protein
MPSLSLTWVTVHDERVCPICTALEGYTWTFQVGLGQLPSELVHPEFGVVWSVGLGSEAHGIHKGSCRCNVNYEFDFSDLVARTQHLLGVVKSAQVGGVGGVGK